jgi:hypothetical protein
MSFWKKLGQWLPPLVTAAAAIASAVKGAKPKPSVQGETMPQPDTPPVVVTPEPTPEPPKPTYPAVTSPLVVKDNLFTVDGRPWRWMYLSMFTALRRFCDGEDLTPLVQLTHALGANGWRVFCQHYYMDWPDIRPFVAPIDQIRPFVDYLATQGLRCELTILCDCQLEAFNQDTSAQAARVRDVLSAVSGAVNITVEYANEPDQNGIDIAALLGTLGTYRPVLAASGWYPVTGSESTALVLDYTGDHPPRKSDSEIEAAKIGAYVTKQTGKPWIGDEWLKFGTADSDGKAVDDPQRAAELFGGMALAGAGGTFHCISGIHAQPFNDVEIACARAAFDAMRTFPPDAPSGAYWHDGMDGPLLPVTDQSTVGEVAGRICGDTAYGVAALAKPGYSPQPASGWAITARSGAKGERITLRRL